MRRKLSKVLFVFFAFYLSAVFTNALALDVDSIFQKIKGDLLNKGLTSTDLNSVEKPTKSMLSLGASQSDVKNMLLDFANKGFKGTSLESLVTMVNDLMKSGDSFKLAKNFVSQALQKASASGLKGDTLIAKVQSLVSQHQDQITQIKSNLGSKLSGFLKSK